MTDYQTDLEKLMLKMNAAAEEKGYETLEEVRDWAWRARVVHLDLPTAIQRRIDAQEFVAAWESGGGSDDRLLRAINRMSSYKGAGETMYLAQIQRVVGYFNGRAAD